MPRRQPLRGRALRIQEEKEKAARAETQSQKIEQSLQELNQSTVEPDDTGEDCELHVYEQRFDTYGDLITLRVGTKSVIDLEPDRSHRAAFVVTRHYDEKKRLEDTQLEIRSPYINKALKTVVGSYPGLTISSAARIVMPNVHCLFHYRHELKRYADDSDNPNVKDHMNLCLQYMAKTLDTQLQAYNKNMINVSRSPSIEHANLWMAYRPGTVVYQRESGIERLFQFRWMALEDMDSVRAVPQQRWRLSLASCQYDGRSIGQIESTVVVSHYDGNRPIIQMDAFPLEFHPEKERVEAEALGRGRKYVRLLGTHHMSYCGQARMCYPIRGPSNNNFFEYTIPTLSRIIVDCEFFQQKCHIKLAFIANSPEIQITPEYDPETSIEDEYLLILSPFLPGYSLRHKSWAHFQVDNISEIDFNASAFDNLVLPANTKNLISSLITPDGAAILSDDPSSTRTVTTEIQVHEHDESHQFDDLIRGKGRSLIFLLHGPPGVGKTYTAESIADRTRRPLLPVNSGQLIGPSHWVEVRLEEILSLATRWKAIVLIDEADVFLQQRTTTELDRNGMVSSLLRIVEYFDGTMFLTTNRFDVMDSAFKSRIHLAIAYPAISREGRRQLWTTTITRACGGEPPGWLGEGEKVADEDDGKPGFLDQLTEEPVNGREIKNIVSMASAVARNGRREMRAGDIWQGIEALRAFEENFKASGGEAGSARGKTDSAEKFDDNGAIVSRADPGIDTGRADHKFQGYMVIPPVLMLLFAFLWTAFKEL